MSATEQNNLQRIADQSRSLAEFYDKFLEHVCNELAAIGAVAWECSQTPMTAISQYQTAKDVPIKMQISQRRHQEILNQGRTNAPFVESGDPTILMAKLPRGEAVDLIEVFLPTELDKSDHIKKLRDLEAICHSAKAITTRTAMPAAAEENSQSSKNLAVENLDAQSKKLEITADQLDEYAHVLHQSLDPRDAANKIANETRRMLDCDRVTVFKVTGKRVIAVAVSGQPNVNRRSNAVARMERLAQRVLMTKQSFWYPTTQAQPPQIEQRLNEYLADASTRSMVINPIFDIAPSNEMKPGDRDQPKPRLIGGIAIEQCDRQWDAATITAPIEMLTRHSSDAFRNAYRHRQLFAYPIWHWLGKSKIIFAARHLPKTIAAIALLTLLGLVLAFVQTDFRMSCEGQLMPKTHRFVFANIDGIVKEVLIKHGDDVDEGQPLVQIGNLELDQQIQVAIGKINELEEVIVAARATMSNRNARSANEAQQENVASMKAQLASAELELKLLQEKSKRLSVVSPIAGKIVTYNVRDTLANRPVQRVESLLEVADINGDWTLELSLPDRKIGHVLTAFEQSDDGQLPIEFILAADPDRTYHGVLNEVGHAMTMTSEKGQCMTLKVSIEDPDFALKQLRSGASAYIHCGQRSVGYAWFHSAWEFIQTKILFPFF